MRPLGSLALAVLALAATTGCGVGSGPKRQVETPSVPPGPEYVSAASAASPVTASAPSSAAPPRAIFDYNVAPAEYSLKPLEKWTEQEAAADALGRIGPSAVPQLIEALRSRDSEARLQAAQVLARMGSDAKEAVPDLVRLLEDPDERIRKAATRTLGRIGPDAAEAVPVLMQKLLKPEDR
jgi:HEAT repeat protein